MLLKITLRFSPYWFCNIFIASLLIQLPTNSYCQSKKEQIAALEFQLDSLKTRFELLDSASNHTVSFLNNRIQLLNDSNAILERKIAQSGLHINQRFFEFIFSNRIFINGKIALVKDEKSNQSNPVIS